MSDSKTVSDKERAEPTLERFGDRGGLGQFEVYDKKGRPLVADGEDLDEEPTEA